jgi:tetratricopeptide (TPR) repeat protein
MSGSWLRFVSLVAVAGALATTGCSEVRGRRKLQEGNQLFRDGNYKEAVAAFEEAEHLVPDFWKLWLNKGYTCRQMIIPGAKTPESIAASKCALAAFKRMMELKPDDPRGELLYVQTLFDSDEYETLAKMYEARFQKNPRDLESVTGLIQVYSKWNKLDDALQWYFKKAEIQQNDPEAQYSVGVFVWQQLMQKGGGPEKAQFDPRPDPNKPKEKKVPPPFGYGDIVSQQRVDYADMGIKYLEKAIAMRPKYHEAMTYANLLWRQRSFALYDAPEEWQKSVDKAEEWRKKALEAQGKPVALQPKVEPAAGEEPAADATAEEATPAAAVTKKATKTKAAKKRARKGKRRT